MNRPAQMDNNVAPIDLDSYNEMFVGDILRKTREYYGQSLAQVEGSLNIRASQLDALEKLKLDKLPGRVYAIGFVRAYSEYLGLDGDKMVHLFKAQSVGKEAKPNLQFPVTYDENNTPNLAIILTAIVGLILLIAFLSIKAPSPYKESIPPVPKALMQGYVSPVEKPKAVSPKTVDPKTVTTKAKAQKIELVITQDSWIEIKDTEGEKLISQVLRAGDKYILPNKEGLKLTTGNAGGVEVHVDGKKIKKIGRTSEVKRDIPLIAKNFKKND